MLNLNADHIAIAGYDPVSYVGGEPQPGDPTLVVEYAGGTYQFANAINRDLFRSDPDRYLPQYGGFCATAVSEGKTFGIDPTNYKLIDGKLYLFYRGDKGDAKAMWEPTEATRIPSANAHWAQGNLPAA